MKHDTEQFKATYLPLQPAMQCMAQHILGNEDEAADVVQDCFVSLWNERRRLHSIQNPEAYAITLAKRRSIDALRKRHPYVDIDERTLTTEPNSNADERLDLIHHLLERLPERQASVVRLRHYNDLDTHEIASAMHISESNVYTLLSRAYSTLKQMISEI